MRIKARWAQRTAAALAVVIVAAGLFLALPSRAQAQIDLSGDWMLTLSGDIADTCKGTYSQSGSSLSTYIECEAHGTVSQAGTIDPSTGSYNLTGEVTVGETTYQVETLGTASPDGNTVGGTWSVPAAKVSGTFAGIRQSDPQDPPCSILHPCRSPEIPTASPAPGTPPATATPSSAALALPETGASRPASSVSLESLVLLAAGGAALTLGGAAWYARRRWPSP